MTQDQFFDECLRCGRRHVSVRSTKPKLCVECKGPLVAVGGVLNGQRIDIQLTDAEREHLIALHLNR